MVDLDGKFFSGFKNLKKYCLKGKTEKVDTDNWVFQLYHMWSLVLVLIAIIVVIARQVLFDDKDRMMCFGQDQEYPSEDFLNNYCHYHGTFIVPEFIEGKHGINIPHRGIHPDLPDTTQVYQLRYLYYIFILIIQYYLFRASKMLWRILEGGRIRHLVSELTTAIVDDEKMKTRVKLLGDYMTSGVTFHTNYAYRFVACELFNVASLVFQVWLIDAIFDYEYLGFGVKGVRYISSLSANSALDRRITDLRRTPAPIEDPFTKLFPKMTLCKVEIASSGGNTIMHEALCVLPINNVAEKIFFVLWFWLLFLGVMLTIGLIYRSCVLTSKSVRYAVMRLKVKKSECDPKKLRYLVDNFSYADWFVLSLILKNTDIWVSSKLLEELVERMKESEKKSE